VASLSLPPPSFGDIRWWTAALAGVAAVGSLVASLAALRALYYFKGQTRSASQAVGMDCLFRLIEAWDGEAMRRRRTRAAEALSHHSEPTFSQSVFDIANHFELVGFLVFEARVVSETDAWGSFSTWAAPYWHLMQRLLAPQLADDPTLWERYAELVAAFDRIERGRAHLGDGEPLPYIEELDLFLDGERALMEDDAPTTTAAAAAGAS
jgi:hypothetical protein